MVRSNLNKTIAIFLSAVIGAIVIGLFSPVFAQGGNGTGTVDEWAELFIILWSILVFMVILVGGLVVWFGIKILKSNRKEL